MNDLEIKTMGIQDLDTNEMVNIDGGIWVLIAGALLGAVLTQDLDSLGRAFTEGYNKSR